MAQTCLLAIAGMIAWILCRDYLEDPRMVWAFILPAVYVFGMLMLRDDT